MIFNQIYLFHRWNHNRYYHSGSEWTYESWQRRGGSTLPKPPELESYHNSVKCER